MVAEIRKRGGWFVVAFLAAVKYLLFSYILSFFVVFVVWEPAYKFDEEYNDYRGQYRSVALGPRPTYWLCTPSYHGVFYHGEEWPFRLYRPLCNIWIDLNGYAPSMKYQ